MEKELAGLWLRFAGLVLEIVLFVVTLGVGWLVWSAVEWRGARTPAKRVLRMRVIGTADGELAPWRTMALRAVYGIGVVGLFGAATLGLGWVIAAAFALSPTRQSMGDRLALTAVVRG